MVSNQRFSQIALLQPDVLNRCQERIDEARSLLGLVLCHVAPHDAEWQQERVVKGRRSRQDVELPVCGALWLADLKFRSWVPVPGDDGKLVKMRADAKTLGDLLDPAWLENNDAAIRLLSEWFEFDELELRLLGLAPDPNSRRELRSGIAKLVETGGAVHNSTHPSQTKSKNSAGRAETLIGANALALPFKRRSSLHSKITG